MVEHSCTSRRGWGLGKRCRWWAVGMLMIYPWDHHSGVGAVTNNTVCTLTTSQVCATGLSCLAPPLGDTYVPDGISICRCPQDYYAGSTCSTQCPGGAGNPCNGHGECRYADITCKCDAGYVGPSGAGECSAACPRSPDGQVCSGRGTCVATGFGTAVCMCNTGLKGDSCQIECKGGAANACSGHGACREDGSCSCNNGWKASDCSVECPGRIGYLGSVHCNGHGDCTEAGFCQCAERWRGLSCDNMCPQSNGVTCGGHGICDPDAVCHCYQGYRGEDCGIRCKGTTQNPCSGHGVCDDAGECSCSSGWVGETCSIPCPGGEGSTCSGHGTCVAEGEYGVCQCDRTPEEVILEYSGSACDSPIFNPATRVFEEPLDRQEDLFKAGENWPTILPPAFIIGTVVAWVLSTIYERWLERVAARNAKIRAGIDALQADDIGRQDGDAGGRHKGSVAKRDGLERGGAGSPDGGRRESSEEGGGSGTPERKSSVEKL